jgi:predicted hotdog family 3-hydroxylacyl-ACP dehydratase
MGMIPLPAIAEVVPHSAPMILLDEILGFDGSRIRCRTTVRTDSLFVEEGRVRAIVALEYMAQAVAAIAGMQGRAAGAPPRVGYVLGTREMTLQAGHFLVGDELLVEAEEVWTDGRMGSFRCTVSRDGLRLAEASINVYRSGEEPSA